MVRLSCTVFGIKQTICRKTPISPPPSAFGAPAVGDSVEFHEDPWHQKTRVPELLCGTVSMILRLAILIKLRLVTDRQTEKQSDRRTDDHRAIAYTALVGYSVAL